MEILTALYIAAFSRMQLKLKDERGATMVEYALLIIFIAFIAVVGAKLLGKGLSDCFTDISGKLVIPDGA